jgi:hypothetical protein
MTSVLPFAAQASLYTQKVKGVFLYDLFKKAGVPEGALQRTFEFLDLNQNKTINVRADGEMIAKNIAKKNYTVIVDFTRPSSEKRFFLLNLVTGQVEKYYVAHGVNTGLNESLYFANIIDSHKSSLGFYLTGSKYEGSNGESVRLFGLEKSNSLAFERSIVLHSASYVSLDYLEKYGRLGHSWGCFVVSEGIIEKLSKILQDGAIIYAYHEKLMTVAQTSPAVQNVRHN